MGWRVRRRGWNAAGGIIMSNRYRKLLESIGEGGEHE